MYESGSDSGWDPTHRTVNVAVRVKSSYNERMLPLFFVHRVLIRVWFDETGDDAPGAGALCWASVVQVAGRLHSPTRPPCYCAIAADSAVFSVRYLRRRSDAASRESRSAEIRIDWRRIRWLTDWLTDVPRLTAAVRQSGLAVFLSSYV